MAGVSRRTVAYYESEKSKSHIENVFAIAKALNVKIDDLIGEPTHTSSTEEEHLQIDARSMEKIKIILSLPRAKRFMIYTMAEALANQKEEKSEDLT